MKKIGSCVFLFLMLFSLGACDRGSEVITTTSPFLDDSYEETLLDMIELVWNQIQEDGHFLDESNDYDTSWTSSNNVTLRSDLSAWDQMEDTSRDGNFSQYLDGVLENLFWLLMWADQFTSTDSTWSDQLTLSSDGFEDPNYLFVDRLSLDIWLFQWGLAEKVENTMVLTRLSEYDYEVEMSTTTMESEDTEAGYNQLYYTHIDENSSSCSCTYYPVETRPADVLISLDSETGMMMVTDVPSIHGWNVYYSYRDTLQLLRHENLEYAIHNELVSMTLWNEHGQIFSSQQEEDGTRVYYQLLAAQGWDSFRNDTNSLFVSGNDPVMGLYLGDEIISFGENDYLSMLLSSQPSAASLVLMRWIDNTNPAMEDYTLEEYGLEFELDFSLTGILDYQLNEAKGYLGYFADAQDHLFMYQLYGGNFRYDFGEFANDFFLTQQVVIN